jgi:ABC-type polysaccharide/polyol phosphate export permease
MASGPARSREPIWRPLLQDFTARYRQALPVLGVAWALVRPHVMVGTFVFRYRSGVLSIGELGLPHPVCALVGRRIPAPGAVD